jgi:coenzyme F420-reducing hydrogenase gamma subunit
VEVRYFLLKTVLLISFSDCAVTANVPGMRKMLGKAEAVLKRTYRELGDKNPKLLNASGIVPTWLERVQPVHTLQRVQPVHTLQRVQYNTSLLNHLRSPLEE